MYVSEHVTTQQQLFADCHLMQIRHLACTELNTVTTETLSSHTHTLNCTLYSGLLCTNRFVKVFRAKWPTSVRTASQVLLWNRICLSKSSLLPEIWISFWKTTNQITKRLQIFINKFLRRIMNIKWTDKITNEELWSIAKQKPTEIELKRRKWNWIGHTLRKEAGATEKTALDWNPQGYRRRGRPKRTWWRAMEDEISTGRSCYEFKGIAGDRNAW